LQTETPYVVGFVLVVAATKQDVFDAGSDPDQPAPIDTGAGPKLCERQRELTPEHGLPEPGEEIMVFAVFRIREKVHVPTPT
jgi:hypothetical protein